MRFKKAGKMACLSSVVKKLVTGDLRAAVALFANLTAMNTLPRLVQRHRKGTTWLLLALLAALALVSAPAWPTGHPAHKVTETVGLLFLVVGVLMRLTATGFIAGRKSGQVIDIGPYSQMRNPLYMGSLFIVAAAGLNLGSLLLALIFCLSGWILFTCLIFAEEQYLLSRFGGTYADYAARTPRWIPRSLHFVMPTTWTIDVKAVSLGLREGFAFFLLVPIAEVIEWAHSTGSLPVLFRLY